MMEIICMNQQHTYNLYEIFVKKSSQHPDDVFIVYNDEMVKYKDALMNVSKIAYALRKAGVANGSNVIMQIGNKPYFIYCFFAILQCNAVPVLVNPMARQYELKYYHDITTPACIITQSFIADRLTQYGLVSRGCKMIVIDDSSNFTSINAILNGDGYDMDYVPEEKNGAAIIFTAAMDGNALGAVLTHTGIYHSAESVAWMLPHYASMMIAALPLFHAFGLTTSLIIPLLSKTEICLVERFSPKRLLKLLLNRKVRYFVGVPAMYSIMKPLFERDIDFSGISLWVSGGDYLSRELQEWYAEKGIIIRQGYGLTEASPIVSWNMPHIENKICSIGKPMPYNEVMIVDEEGVMQSPLNNGEIIVKGINVINHYYNNDQMTQNYIKNGWLYTGDVGYYDNDGYLFITGRKKDMILKNGYNVYPKEVERILQYHPCIESVRVTGHVTFTGDSTIEMLVAEIVCKGVKKLSVDEIKAWCIDNISLYKIPDTIIIR